jgi:hypothetical protein
VTPAELTEVLSRHAQWAADPTAGARADLRGADLRGASLSRADLSGADLSGANLRGADLSGANLRGADLSGAHLRGADLRGADLRGADLSGADLSGASLRGADLRGADLSGAYLPIGWCRWSVTLRDDMIHVGCESKSPADWRAWLDSGVEYDTPRSDPRWPRIRAAILAACTYVEALQP